jgi:hypothetical protein
MECTLGQVSHLLRHSDSVKRVSERELVETVKQKDGVKLTIQQGGCAHYGVTFEFAVPLRDKKSLALLAEAARLMRTVETVEERKDIPSIVAGTLEKNAKLPYTAGEPLADADFPDVNISVTEETTKTHRTIKVLYSMVL